MHGVLQMVGLVSVAILFPNDSLNRDVLPGLSTLAGSPQSLRITLSRLQRTKRKHSISPSSRRIDSIRCRSATKLGKNSALNNSESATSFSDSLESVHD